MTGKNVRQEGCRCAPFYRNTRCVERVGRGRDESRLAGAECSITELGNDRGCSGSGAAARQRGDVHRAPDTLLEHALRLGELAANLRRGERIDERVRERMAADL